MRARERQHPHCVWGGDGTEGAPKEGFPVEVMARLHLEGLELKVKQRRSPRILQVRERHAKVLGGPRRTGLREVGCEAAHGSRSRI